MLPFQFSDAPPPAGAMVIDIPAGVTRKRALLGVLSRELFFPGYFGWNWDALEECLRDLHWLGASRTIVLRHHDVPFPADSPHRALWLAIARDAAVLWGRSGPHRLIVQFPAATQDAVVAALAER